MTFDRTKVKVYRDEDLKVWMLKYGNHPKVLSYSSSYTMLDDMAELIVRAYFTNLKRIDLGSIATSNFTN